MTATDIQDYVPENEWPSVATMLDGFGDQTLPASAALTGTALHLPQDGAGTTTYTFHDAHSLTWTSADGKGDQGAARYKAIEARPGIFIIDFVKGEGRYAENVTIILDRNTGAVTTAISSFIAEGDKIRSTTTFSHGNVDGAAAVHSRSGRTGRQAHLLPLQRRRNLRAHLPQRRHLHLALPPRRRGRTG